MYTTLGVRKVQFTAYQIQAIPAGADEFRPGPSTLRICSPDGGVGGASGAGAGARSGLTAGGTPRPGVDPAA